MSVLLSVTALTLGSGILLAQESDAYLVGGAQVGRWRLGMPEEELVRIFRELFGNQFRTAATASINGGSFHFWEQRGFIITAFQGKVAAISIWRRRTAADAELMKYHTREDIRIGDPLPKAIAAYGTPDRQWLATAGTAMVWDRLGLYLEVRANLVDVLGVYDPRVPWIWR